MSRDRRRRGQGLAARLKAGMDQKLQAEQDQKRSEEQARARAREERDAVMEDLAEFGRALGHLRVRRRRDHLELAQGEAALRFEPAGEAAQIRVSGDGLRGEHLLDWEPRLDRWVLVRRHKLGREHRELLFDAGLMRLMQLCFGLAPAAEEAPTAVTVAPEDEEPPASEGTGGFATKRTL